MTLTGHPLYTFAMHLCPQEIAVVLMAVPFIRMLWLKIRARRA